MNSPEEILRILQALAQRPQYGTDQSTGEPIGIAPQWSQTAQATPYGPPGLDLSGPVGDKFTMNQQGLGDLGVPIPAGIGSEDILKIAQDMNKTNAPMERTQLTEQGKNQRQQIGINAKSDLQDTKLQFTADENQKDRAVKLEQFAIANTHSLAVNLDSIQQRMNAIEGLRGRSPVKQRIDLLTKSLVEAKKNLEDTTAIDAALSDAKSEDKLYQSNLDTMQTNLELEKATANKQYSDAYQQYLADVKKNETEAGVAGGPDTSSLQQTGGELTKKVQEQTKGYSPNDFKKNTQNIINKIMAMPGPDKGGPSDQEKSEAIAWLNTKIK